MPNNSSLNSNANTYRLLKDRIQNSINFHKTQRNMKNKKKWSNELGMGVGSISYHNSTISKLSKAQTNLGACIWEIEKWLDNNNQRTTNGSQPKKELKYCKQFNVYRSKGRLNRMLNSKNSKVERRGRRPQRFSKSKKK